MAADFIFFAYCDTAPGNSHLEADRYPKGNRPRVTIKNQSQGLLWLFNKSSKNSET